MKYLNYLKSFLFFLIPYVILLLLLTILYYYDLLNNNIIKYLKLFILIITTFFSGYKIGKIYNSKGYLKGLTIGIIIVLLFLLISIFLKSFKWQSLIYYFIILITSTIGGILGVNKHN